jgi:glycosyltransferase involved in cell wall biosynthesis
MLVLPSFSEAFGMVLAEAMSCGKPVIGSRIGGIVDVINDGKDGYLTPPGQPKELSSKIIHLLEQPEERKRMGRNAARHVRDQFDWSKIAKRIMEIYDKAIREY